MKEGHENKIHSKETRQSKHTLPIKTPCPHSRQNKENKKRKQANMHCILSIALLYQDKSSFYSWSISNQKKGGSVVFWIKFERMKNSYFELH